MKSLTNHKEEKGDWERGEEKVNRARKMDRGTGLFPTIVAFRSEGKRRKKSTVKPREMVGRLSWPCLKQESVKLLWEKVLSAVVSEESIQRASQRVYTRRGTIRWSKRTVIAGGHVRWFPF